MTHVTVHGLAMLLSVEQAFNVDQQAIGMAILLPAHQAIGQLCNFS